MHYDLSSSGLQVQISDAPGEFLSEVFMSWKNDVTEVYFLVDLLNWNWFTAEATQAADDFSPSQFSEF